MLLLTIALSGFATVSAGDPPQVTVYSPNGGEVHTGGDEVSVTYLATDDVGISEIEVYYRDGSSNPWKQVARGLSNTGSYSWSVHNTPSVDARVRVVAWDVEGQDAEDISDGAFSILQTPGGFVPTTLRDFTLPGSQPFALQDPMEPLIVCGACHGGFDDAVEPKHTFGGSMMAHAARDPLFYACLAIAEQDAPSSGDLCIRCHTPGGWMDGRSNPTDGSKLTALDRESVSCDFCHSMVDPVYQEGISPPEDLFVLEQLDDVPTVYGEGQYVLDGDLVRRGPYGDPMAPHGWIESAFHRSSDLCGTCHNVSNPAFVRVSGADYEPAPLDTPPTDMSPEVLLPLERTYSEWLASDYAVGAGIYAPEFAGNKPGGMVSTCMDCHMRDAEGRGCNSEFAPVRTDLPIHDLTGGNTFIPLLVADLYPDEVDIDAINDGIARARYMLENAADLSVDVQPITGGYEASVTVTNNTGHKLPTGYPEGRRMWLNVRALDEEGAVIYESCAYDLVTATLDISVDPTVYEANMGISQGLAALVGATPGKSFHFALNDTLYKDNRIPARGFLYADYEAFGGAPVDPDHAGPGPRYADGEHWDIRAYDLPEETWQVVVNLYYQTMSREYTEFLRDENVTNDAGQILYDAWEANGKSTPELMATETFYLFPASADELPIEAPALELETGPNPFHETVQVRLALAAPSDVTLEVFDLQGRRLVVVDRGTLSIGEHRIEWDGRDGNGKDAGSGIFWLRVAAGDRVEARRVVRLR